VPTATPCEFFFDGLEEKMEKDLLEQLLKLQDTVSAIRQDCHEIANDQQRVSEAFKQLHEDHHALFIRVQELESKTMLTEKQLELNHVVEDGLRETLSLRMEHIAEKVSDLSEKFDGRITTEDTDRKRLQLALLVIFLTVVGQFFLSFIMR
jgi:predicted nuclease with TOPRIM domain